MKLSVTIITLNEIANIQRAISSVKFADEIIVVDSGSSDKTKEVAQELGAHVVQRAFMGYGQQKNFAASLCTGEWILNLDADEEVSPELRTSIEKILKSTTSEENSVHLYRMARLTFFCGRPIHHGGWYPDYKARLYKKDKVTWTEPNVHEDLRLLHGGQIGILKGDLYHYSFPTVKSQVQTNIRYASLGAKDLVLRKNGKPFFYEMLLRPMTKFLECYVIKFGFLDGKRGLIIALNAAYSMFMKYSFAYWDENYD